MAKYYAVRNGKQIGIFTNWEECKKSVEGYPSAEYKSFTSREKALAYMAFSSEEPEELKGFEETDIPLCGENELIAFVDGSYDASSHTYAFGCVIIKPDQSREFMNGTGNNPEAVDSRNVSGELLGTMTAIKYAVTNSYKKLTVYHDYEGIAKWYNGVWKAKTFVSISYLNFVDKYRNSVDVNFVKVDAHTGNTLNEEADRLAKEALGIKK